MDRSAEDHRLSTGIPELDGLLEGGIRAGSLAGLVAPTGAGKRVFAAEFLLSAGRMDGQALWIDLLGGEEGQLPPGIDDRFRASEKSGRIRLVNADPEDLAPEPLLELLAGALDPSPCRAVIAGGDMLARLGDPILPLRVYRMLRKKGVTAYVLFSGMQGDHPARHFPPETLEPLNYLFRCFFDFDGEGQRRHRFAVEKATPPSLMPALQAYTITRDGIAWGSETAAAPPSPVTYQPLPPAAVPATPELTVFPELYYCNEQSERIVARRLKELNRQRDRWDISPHPQRIHNSLQYNRLFEAFRAGEHVADMMIVDIYRLRECIERGLIHPLDDFVDEEWEQQFLPVALDQCRINGSLWAIPHWVNSGVMICREDLLQRHGLKPPSTFDELVDACQFLLGKSRKSGMSGFGFAGAIAEALSCNFLEFLWNSGGDVFDEMGHLRLRDEAAVTALTRMTKLIHDWGISPPDTPAMSEADVTRRFRQGNLLFLRSWPNHLAGSGADPAHTAAHTSLAPLPSAEGAPSRAVIGGFCYVIPRSVADPQLLLDFHREFHSPETIEAISLHGWTCPPFRSVYTNRTVLRHRPYYEGLPELLARGRGRGSIPYYHRLTPTLREQVNRALTRGKEPEAALESIAHAFGRYTLRQSEANRLRDALDFVRTHLEREISRDEVARRCGVNPTYFSTLFKELTGTTFSRYVNQERIRKARRLLETSEQPVGEVARKVGFSDPSYFSLVFRDHTKMTPGRFRESARERRSHH